ncbi:hypothetical protein L484_015640 [Morus notabilis]|uniref:Uncharacterized protein n=1 Tax=Morus notabilis TaxID=981085 RepID=W9QYF6_9ROSA|nr:hypothetical protein L484_015640 [Morus notabilis]
MAHAPDFDQACLPPLHRRDDDRRRLLWRNQRLSSESGLQHSEAPLPTEKGRCKGKRD